MAYSLSLPNIANIANAAIDAFETETTNQARAAAEVIKMQVRGHINQNTRGRKTRLPNTFKADVYPDQRGRSSANPTVLSYTTAPEILFTLDEGATVRARNGEYLAIPTRAVRRQATGFRKPTPTNWNRLPGNRNSTLVLTQRKRGNRLILIDAKTKKLQFTLVRRARIPRKLNLRRHYFIALTKIRDRGIARIRESVIRNANQAIRRENMVR